VRLAVDDKQVQATYGETLVSHAKIEGEFPDYRQVVPDATKCKVMVTFDQAAMKSALESVQGAHGTCSHTKGVILEIKAGELRLEAECPDGGKADTALATAGRGNLTVGFNSQYLLDVVNVLPGAGDFYFIDEESPMLCLAPSEAGFTAVVMPMRL
jgi:DNA polymerase-3 subunit beta